MATSISKTKNFFIEGSGTARVIDNNNALSLIHLQDMTLELTSTMENIYGGEGNFALYSYNTEKGLKVSFTNASWNLDIMNLTQGTTQDSVATLFTEEKVSVGGTNTAAAGNVKVVNHNNVDYTSPIMLYSAENEVVFSWDGETITNGTGTIGSASGTYTVKLPSTYYGQTLTAVYNYTVPSSSTQTDAIVGVGSSLYTTGIPGFVTIHHKSKPMKQKDGRIIRVFTTVYRARCDGSLTIDFKHKNAFAPELAFEVVDPERKDRKYMISSIIDTTAQDKDNKNTVFGF